MNKLLYLGNKLSGKGYTPTTIDTLAKDLSSEGYKVITASSKQNKAARLWDMWWHIFKYRNQVDGIIIDTYSTLNFYYAYSSSLLARLFKIPYIPILHGGNLPKRIKSHPNLCKQLFGKAYVNVAPSRYLMEAFQQAGFTNLQYIPNSIDLTIYPVVEKQFDSPRLLWVRSLAAIYNPIMAVKVIEQLITLYPKATLTMIGPDKDGSLQQLQKYCLDKKLPVIFTGKLSKAEWVEVSKSHNIFINTTHADNTPVSVMEAMALGFPIVSTNVGGIPFLVKDKVEAILVNDNDCKGMADAIVQLMENPTLTKSLQNNAIQKAKSWDWNEVKGLWNKILRA